MDFYTIFAKLLASVLMFPLCLGYPSGAPTTACSTLTPVHRDNYPQQSQPPYTVTATKVGDKVKVTISSPIGENFQGFVIQARSSRNKKRMVEGKFTPRNDVSQAIDCSGGRQNTLTQVNKNDKSQIVTEWTPSNGVDEDVIFRATVAKTFQYFWTEIDSSPVRVRTSQGGQSSKQNGKSDSESMYDNCFVSKGCIGYPADCVTQRNCDVFLSYVDVGSGVSFKMTGNLGSSPKYMAAGLSTDKLMGGDSVTECFMENGMVVVQHSRNERRDNIPLTQMPEGMYEWEFKNGMTTCNWIRPYVTNMENLEFDLLNDVYYILIAKGPILNGRIQYHEYRLPSKESVNFTAYEMIEGEGVHDAIKIHGESPKGNDEMDGSDESAGANSIQTFYDITLFVLAIILLKGL